MEALFAILRLCFRVILGNAVGSLQAIKHKCVKSKNAELGGDLRDNKVADDRKRTTKEMYTKGTRPQWLASSAMSR